MATAALTVCKAAVSSTTAIKDPSPDNDGALPSLNVSVVVKTALLSGVPSAVSKVTELIASTAASNALSGTLFGPSALSRPSPKVSNSAKVIVADGSSVPVYSLPLTVNLTVTGSVALAPKLIVVASFAASI